MLPNRKKTNTNIGVYYSAIYMHVYAIMVYSLVSLSVEQHLQCRRIRKTKHKQKLTKQEGEEEKGKPSSLKEIC